MRADRRSIPLALILSAVILLLGTLSWTLDSVGKSAAATHNYAAQAIHKMQSIPSKNVTLHTFDADTLITIMPLGDSITAGVNSSYDAGYRLSLWEECVAARWHVHFVGSRANGPETLPESAHEGHSGWRIDQLSAHIVSWLSVYRPQVILLHIGTNDILQHYPLYVALERLNILIDQITTALPHTDLIIAQITPLGLPQLDTEVVSYNSLIPDLVKQKEVAGKQVEYVDMYDTVPVNDISDSIHPDDQGYALMARIWFHALSDIVVHM